MKAKFNKKMETPLYENKAESPISNKVEVIMSHDGLPIGMRFEANEDTIQKMIELGFWKRV